MSQHLKTNSVSLLFLGLAGPLFLLAYLKIHKFAEAIYKIALF